MFLCYNFPYKTNNKTESEKQMADPNKFKSVSVPIETYKKLNFLADGKFLDAQLTISKTIEALASRAAKKLGYKNGNGKA